MASGKEPKHVVKLLQFHLGVPGGGGHHIILTAPHEVPHRLEGNVFVDTVPGLDHSTLHSLPSAPITHQKLTNYAG